MTSKLHAAGNAQKKLKQKRNPSIGEEKAWFKETKGQSKKEGHPWKEDGSEATFDEAVEGPRLS